MALYSVVIVEDHTLLSQAIESLVNSFDDFRVTYTCSNGEDLLKKLNDSDNIPNIVLMDVNMPVLNGIQTTHFLKKNYPMIAVLALSVERQEETVIDMIQAGAKGYLLKDVEKTTLETALKEVITYGYYHTRTVASILMNSVSSSKEKVKLKEREIEFIKYACSELTYKEIAKKMYKSPKTIDGYRDYLFQKLHIKNRIGLVVYAIKNKIFNP